MDLGRTAQDVPEIKALNLVTIYCDEGTTLVSLAHNVLIAAWDGEEKQMGIPHLYLTDELEQAIGSDYFADWDANEEGFPGWPAVLAYVKTRPSLFDKGNS